MPRRMIMKKENYILSLAVIFALVFSLPDVSAQTRKKRGTVRKKPVGVGNSNQANADSQCTTKNSSDDPPTYLVGASKVGKTDRKRIEKDYGTLVIPQGETAYAKQLREKAEAWRRRQLDEIYQSLEIWRKSYPDATEEQIKKRLERQKLAVDYFTNNQRDKNRIASARWDWREHQIDVGPVLNQGLRCNTCWAFTAADAAGASQQKDFEDKANGWEYRVAKDGDLIPLVGAWYWWLGNPGPFVQDLLNCMEIPKENICRDGWHGRAFDFMVYDRGVPLAVADGYREVDEAKRQTFIYRRAHQPREKFACQPTAGFAPANSWDYVNYPPDKLPTVEQLKTALIEHGPLVAGIVYDNCLRDYKGGVFNEKNLSRINHVVLLIGWDDAKGAWLIKNSWGTEWGEKGFAWIKYGSNNIGVFAAWIDAPSITQDNLKLIQDNLKLFQDKILKNQ